MLILMKVTTLVALQGILYAIGGCEYHTICGVVALNNVQPASLGLRPDRIIPL